MFRTVSAAVPRFALFLLALIPVLISGLILVCVKWLNINQKYSNG